MSVEEKARIKDEKWWWHLLRRERRKLRYGSGESEFSSGHLMFMRTIGQACECS